MKFKWLLSLVGISMNFSTVSSQDVQRNFDNISNHVFLPQGVDNDALSGPGINEKFDMFSYQVRSNKISLLHLKTIYPDADLPDEIIINAPWAYTHNTEQVMLGMTNTKGDLSHLVVMFVGDIYEKDVTYYVDKSIDGEFKDWAIIKVDQKSKKVNIDLTDSRSKDKISLTLWNIYDKIQKQKEKFRKKRIRVNLKNKFSLGINATFGSGKMDYHFFNTQTEYPNWYDTDYTILKFGIDANYDFSIFRVIGGADIQAFNYYTSYTRRQFGEPISRRTSQGLQIFEQVEINRNHEKQPTAAINLYAGAAVKIPLSRHSTFQPEVRYGVMRYIPDEFYPDRNKTNTFYPLSNTNFINIGCRVEFTVGNERAFYFGLSYKKVKWRPEDFVNSLPQDDSFDSNFNILQGDFGYRFGL